jgi:AcrR family transcriptional regulator
MRYEKGRKESSKRRILEIAARKFRTDGIAATGLAGIMSDAGLTNGAFYLQEQSEQIAELLLAGGPDLVIDTYLSTAHRDNPGIGCASSALLPELGREPAETRHLYTKQVLSLVRQVADRLDPQVADRQDVAIAMFAMLVGTLQLARAVDDPELSNRILASGATAARALARP